MFCFVPYASRFTLMPKYGQYRVAMDPTAALHQDTALLLPFHTKSIDVTGAVFALFQLLVTTLQ
jgi:hypothetical protein